MEPQEILFGLGEHSSNEEIREKAFDLIGRIRFIPSATVNRGRPECRILDYHRLEDGNLYFMTSRGKPTFRQLRENPELTLNTLVEERYSLRLSARAEETRDRGIWEAFFERNPGTRLMYRKNLDIVALMTLARGEGELFHLYASERIRRVRFAFGGATTRPLSYAITEQCTGCGVCRENCVEEAIFRLADGRYRIREVDCDDCGICYTRCPHRDRALICRLGPAL